MGRKKKGFEYITLVLKLEQFLSDQYQVLIKHLAA
jgi:hypothetical protein